jgi:hypothetical protein
MPGGRPTDDPKTELVAFRLAARHVRWLARRARREGVTLSEAMRLLLDEAAGYSAAPRPRRKRARPRR